MFKILITLATILLILTCTPTLTYDTVRVSPNNYYTINNWKSNGVKIGKIDTVKNLKGEIDHFNVKVR